MVGLVGFLLATGVVFFATGFLTTGFLMRVFLNGVGAIAAFGAATPVFFLPINFELSNAKIGTKINLRKRIPSPNVQCFQKFSAILKHEMIITITKTGGNTIVSNRRPDILATCNRTIILYTGTKIAHPGSPAFLNTFHPDINIKIASPNHTAIRTIASHPTNAPKTELSHIIASGFMFPVNAAHSNSKEKFIEKR